MAHVRQNRFVTFQSTFRTFFPRLSLLLGSTIFAPVASAQNGGNGPRTLMVDIGTRFDFLTILYRIINFLAITIGSLSVALFIAGALILTASRGKDDMVQWGRDLMTGSVFGLVVALSSYAMLRTIYFFLYVQ